MNSDRHSMIQVNCEWCGTQFMARKERVQEGLGKYCSKNCFNEFQRENRKKLWGRKDLAKKYRSGDRYISRWYDDGGRTVSTSYPRWWWEVNIGEIPDGMIILYKDNNPLNINPSNFELGTHSMALKKANATRKSDSKAWADYRNNASRRQAELWASGRFDHLKGETHYAWKGGTKKLSYSKKFKEIREFIRERDGYMCQICGTDTPKGSRRGEVHHMDGNKLNDDYGNLINLCKKCHSQVHSSKNAPPPILALRSLLG